MKTFKFYGVDNNCYKLDDTIWEAIEDPNDGYRSSLGSVQRANKEGLIFSETPLADVYVKQNQNLGIDGFDLVDFNDGFVWLSVGTEDYEDWYPCFIFRFNPKPPDYNAWKSFISEEE